MQLAFLRGDDAGMRLRTINAGVHAMALLVATPVLHSGRHSDIAAHTVPVSPFDESALVSCAVSIWCFHGTQIL